MKICTEIEVKALRIPCANMHWPRFMKMNATKAQYRAFPLRFTLIHFWHEALLHLAHPQETGGFASFLGGTFAGLTSRSR